MVIYWTISSLFHTYWLVSLLLLLPLQCTLQITIDSELDYTILPSVGNFNSFHCSYDRTISFSESSKACGTQHCPPLPSPQVSSSALWLSFLLYLYWHYFTSWTCQAPSHLCTSCSPALNSLPSSVNWNVTSSGRLSSLPQFQHPSSPFSWGWHSHSGPAQSSGHHADVFDPLWGPVFLMRLHLWSGQGHMLGLLPSAQSTAWQIRSTR